MPAPRPTGVAAHAEVTLGGRPAFITTCTGGLRVYHAYVPEREVIVSVFSLGEQPVRGAADRRHPALTGVPTAT